MQEYVGKRILFTCGRNDAIRQAKVTMISPNGKFVNLGGMLISDEPVGWVEIDSVNVKDVVIGDEDEFIKLVHS